MVVDTSVWATSPLGVSVSHIICRFYLFIFSSWLCCSLRFQNSPTGPLVRGFPDIWKLLFFYDSFSGTGLHPQLFCLSFYRLYFVLLSFEENGLPSGCLVSSARVQRLFCCVCSVFKWSFDEFVVEKVVSPYYSSAILGPPLKINFLKGSHHSDNISIRSAYIWFFIYFISFMFSFLSINYYLLSIYVLK